MVISRKMLEEQNWDIPDLIDTIQAAWAETEELKGLLQTATEGVLQMDTFGRVIYSPLSESLKRKQEWHSSRDCVHWWTLQGVEEQLNEARDWARFWRAKFFDDPREKMPPDDPDWILTDLDRPRKET